MALQEKFSQAQLIGATGFQHPEGVCLGLVAQWLISIKNNDEKQFWKDLKGSLKETPDTPLLGCGYARKAIEFQGEYIVQPSKNLSTGQFTRDQLKGAGHKFDNAVADAISAFSAEGLNAITTRVLNNDCRYFILGIRGDGGHAIGIHREYKLLGKSTVVKIFDPNLGQYLCDGDVNIRKDLAAIGARYGNHFDVSYLLEGYGG